MEKPLHSSFQLIQKYRPALNLLPLILLTALLSLANLRATAEGTKQMEPNTPSAANGSLGLVFYNGGWTFNGYRIPFAAAGCLPKYRLNVYIANPGAETVYFGFTQDGTDALYFRLIDPDGLPVPGFDFTSQPTAGNSGYINSYTEAIAGPKFGAVNPTGYDPLSFVPTKVGNYYIEFATDASGNVNFNANGQTLEYFDLSVYDGTTEKPGRLWSKAWQFNNQITGNHAPATDFYILSDDSIVTKLNINKWGGGHFMFYCNQWGAVNTGNWIDDRKSLNDLDQFSWPGDVPQYKVFLNDPDINIFPTGTFGQICDVSSNSNCDGTVDILLKVNKPGSMSLTIDVDPQGSNSGEDVTLTANVLGSTGCSTWESIPWDGNNGFGVPVQNGATINMNIDYLNGLTNLPIYDIETNSDGIMVDLVRPPSTTGSSHLQIQWDDTNLIPMAANVTKTEFIGCQYPGVSVNPPYGAITGCHDWPMEEDNTFNDVFHGNFDIINSWWYYLTQGTINLSLVIKRLPETPAVTPSGNNPVCVGQTGIVYTIPAIANAQSYIWTLPDGTVDTTATNSITLNFPTLASGGTLFVHGNNTSCGNGLNSPALTIVVNPDPLPTIAGTLAMCSGTTQTYNAAPLTLTSYTWTATNGTIIGSNTLPAVTVQWTAAGTQNLELVTTSFNCGTRTTTQTVTVHPLPQPGFSYANNCAGQIVQFTDNTTIATGSVTGWSWNFGDASPVSTLQNPTHTYAVGNTYPVTLTSTSDQGCQASASLMVPVTTPPSANAGVNNSVCANSTYTVVGATASNYSILNWTSSGTGIFNNASFLNPVYSPSAADISAGFVTLTLTANGNTPCGNTTSSITLTINPLPLANAGLDVNTCQGMNFTVSDATALNTTVGGIAWTENGPGSLINANTLTPTYIPVPGETGSVTLTLTIGGSLTCLSETSTDSKVLTFTPLPDVTAGADATICAANNYTLNGTAQFCGNHSWSCSGDGTFSNPNLLNAVYTPGPADIAAGSVSLTLTGEGTGTCVGIFDSDAMTLIIDPMPTAYAGIDDAFCVLNPIPVTGATATNYTTLQWFGGDGAFNNNTLLSPTYMPGNIDFNAGSVILTLAVHGALSCASQTLTQEPFLQPITLWLVRDLMIISAAILPNISSME
ncbi:MAG: PKD domain-containing protein [Bacteroidales bacterium]|nr:PKD domain-containing protein [Bacteroidales bacterium]